MTERTRQMVSDDIKNARDDIEFAEGEIEDARDRLSALEDELKTFPPEGADEERFYAYHDSRQIWLNL